LVSRRASVFQSGSKVTVVVMLGVLLLVGQSSDDMARLSPSKQS
jgi:hypothetical protein